MSAPTTTEPFRLDVEKESMCLAHYLAVDFMPDPGSPRPHLLDGYVTPFEL